MASDKDHMNVGTLGHSGHGKSTLTCALANHLSGTSKFTPSTLPPKTIEYESATRHYAHDDLRGGQEHSKKLISTMSSLDTAIIVVSATEGMDKETREHILLAKNMGVSNIVFFLNKCDESDADEEIMECIEMELSDLIDKLKMNSDRVSFIRGSALTSDGIEELVQKLDELDIPQRDVDSPFMMPVEKVFTIKGVGIAAVGTVERGAIRVGDTVHLIGGMKGGKTRAPIEKNVLSLQNCDNNVPDGTTGDQLGMCFRSDKNFTRADLTRGMYVIEPGKYNIYNKFQAQVHFYSVEDGGKASVVFSGLRCQLFIKTDDVSATVQLGSEFDTDGYEPCEVQYIDVLFDLEQPTVVWEGLSFTLREGGAIVGHGIVKDVSENWSVKEFG